MFNNDNRTVLITGSSGGIGREICREFANNKWNIVCHYNSAIDEVKELEKEFENNNYNYYFVQGDFSVENGIECFINKIKDFQIDSIINNSGVSLKNKEKIEDIDLSTIISLFRINVFSAMALVSKFFHRMKEKKFGRIVNVSSIAAKYGSSVISMPYGCSKLAMEGITKTFAREGAEYNILVNTVRPGLVNTNFHKKVPKNMKERISLIPMKKMIEAIDIAHLIYYLGSEKNNYITNDIITIAGGE